MVDLAVIVVNYESGDGLRRCVASVLAQEPAPGRLVVVDNGSSDGSCERLPDGVVVVRPPGGNVGFGAAVLAGLAASDERFVLTLNPDAVLEPGALAAATAALEGDHRAGAVALRVLQAADPSRIDATGIGLTSRLGQINWDHGLPADAVGEVSHEVLGPLGGAALFRRRALEQAGSFRTWFFLYWEDVDVAIRLQRAGYTCRTVPAATVLHEGSGTIGRWSSTNVFYMVRNHGPCLLASLPGRVLVSHALALLLAPLRAAALYALRGRPLPALAGLLCSPALVPRALAARRRLPRTGSGRHAARRMTELMEAADRNRQRLRTEAPPLPRRAAR